MNINEIEMMIIGVIVSILVVMGALVPIVSSATASSDTFTNDGLYYVDSVPTDGIRYTYENGALSVNGVEVLGSGQSIGRSGGTSVIFTEHIAILWIDGANVLRIRGVANVNVSMLDITIMEGTITGSYINDGTSHPINWAYTEFNGIVPQSERVMSLTPIYVNSNSDIFTTNLIRVVGFASEYYIAHVIGSIDDGIQVLLYNQGSGTAVTGVTATGTVNYHAVEGHKDLYLIDDVVLEFSRDNEGVTETGTYSLTVMTAPEKVVADRTNTVGSTVATIVNLVPLLAILSILVGLVGMHIFRRV